MHSVNISTCLKGSSFGEDYTHIDDGKRLVVIYTPRGYGRVDLSCIAPQRADRKSSAFNRRTVLTRYFHQWHSNRSDWAQLYEHRYQQPILYWGLHRTRKTFRAWRSYIQEKRELKERIKEAMGWKKERTMRKVAVQWLQVADHIQKSRAEKAMMDQAALTVESLRKVQKFAFRWRAKTLSSRARKAGEAGLLILFIQSVCGV